MRVRSARDSEVSVATMAWCPTTPGDRGVEADQEVLKPGCRGSRNMIYTQAARGETMTLPSVRLQLCFQNGPKTLTAGVSPWKVRVLLILKFHIFLILRSAYCSVVGRIPALWQSAPQSWW